jgi:hypothetical protein
MDAVWPAEHAFTPGAQKIALGVEYSHRVLTAVEGINPILPVDTDCSAIAQGDFLGHLRPILMNVEGVFAASELNRHAPSPSSFAFASSDILDKETQIRRALRAAHSQ